jgi:hypothetical protein
MSSGQFLEGSLREGSATMRRSRTTIHGFIQSLESRRLLSASALDTTTDTRPTLAPALKSHSILADLNGDHRADQVTVTRSNSAGVVVAIAIGTGVGTFRWSDSVKIWNNTAVAVAVGDLNGDGAADVSVAGQNPLSMQPSNFGTFVLTFFGDGHGHFKRVPPSTNAANGAPITHGAFVSQISVPTALVLADLDGSGFGDLAVHGALRQSNTVSANATPGVVVTWDPTLPTFAPVPPTVVPLSSLGQTNQLLGGDLNRDGRIDLVATRSSPLPPSPLAVVRPDLATISFPTSRDAVVRQGINPLYLSNTPSPTVAPVPMTTLGLADVDGGGLELVGRVGNSTIRYSSYDASSNGFFRPAQTAKSIGLPSTVSLGRMLLGDIDGDGLSDLLAESYGGPYLGRNISNTVDALGVTFSWSKVVLTPGTNAGDGTIGTLKQDDAFA